MTFVRLNANHLLSTPPYNKLPTKKVEKIKGAAITAWVIAFYPVYGPVERGVKVSRKSLIFLLKYVLLNYVKYSEPLSSYE